MSEGYAPKGLSPDYLVRIYEKPLEEAALSVSFAAHHLEKAQEAADATPESLATAEQSFAWAERQRDTLQAAGRAALATIEDFPPESTLRAQMKMDLRPQTEIDAVFDHIRGMNEYAATDNAVIAVVSVIDQKTSDPAFQKGTSTVSFVAPSREEGPAIKLERDDGRHYLEMQIDKSFTLALDPHVYTSLRASRQKIFPIQGAAEQLAFAVTPEDVEHSVAEPIAEGEAPIVVYGNEAVQRLIELLEESKEGISPLLYGSMHYLERDYDIESLGKSPEAQLRAMQGFQNELDHYISRILNRQDTYSSVYFEDFILLTPEVQQFIGFTDATFAARVRETIMAWTQVGSDTSVGCAAMEDVPTAWATVADRLEKKGFGGIAARMRDPAAKAHGVASIEYAALNEALENTGKLVVPTRRALKRARSQVAYRLDALER